MMSVIINGGGISGAALALILSKLTNNTLDINLIDIHSPEQDLSLFNNSRCIALSYGSYYKLMSFFNISSFLSSCSTAIKKIEVCYINRKKIVFTASDYNISGLGYVIELQNIRKKIFDLLRQSPSVKLFCPSRLKKVQQNRFNNIVTLEDGNEIFSQLLVAADGSYSSLASLCGMQWDFHDYKQVAVIANVFTSCQNEGRAFEIFTSYGSLALLPVSNNKSFLIWCIPFSYKREFISWSSSEFCKNLQKTFGWELGYILDVDKRDFFSLFLRKSKSHILHRLALVGNAAQTLHPIAGQGFNLGFRDVISIANIISYANMKKIDIGDNVILNLYQRNRELDQFKMITMTHGLVYFFNHSCYFFRFSGNCILSAMGSSSLLRSLFLKIILNY